MSSDTMMLGETDTFLSNEKVAELDRLIQAKDPKVVWHFINVLQFGLDRGLDPEHLIDQMIDCGEVLKQKYRSLT